MTEIKCGTIYKLTSPSGKVYIGQTTRPVEMRWKDYETVSNCKGQTKLYRSLQKYGYENHVKEVIITGITSKEMLDSYEMFYIAVYDSCKNGLNCTLGGEGRLIPEDELTYGKRQWEDPDGYHLAVMRSKWSYFGEAYETVFSAITEEPLTVEEIANKTGMNGADVHSMLTVASYMSAPFKKITIKVGENRYGAAYYFPSAEENKHDRGVKVGKLTKAECPNKGSHGNYLSDEELIRRAGGKGKQARNARMLLKRRAEKRACGSNG